MVGSQEASCGRFRNHFVAHCALSNCCPPCLCPLASPPPLSLTQSSLRTLPAATPRSILSGSYSVSLRTLLHPPLLRVVHVKSQAEALIIISGSSGAKSIPPAAHNSPPSSRGRLKTKSTLDHVWQMRRDPHLLGRCSDRTHTAQPQTGTICSQSLRARFDAAKRLLRLDRTVQPRPQVHCAD